MPKVDDVAHLLKHLNDASKLRSNPLAVHFFAGVETGHESENLILRRVRAAVRRALEAVEEPRGTLQTIHERRRAFVLRRCELQGAPHKEVAAELGIGMRHFYRELKKARERFSQCFQALDAPVPREAFSRGFVDISSAEIQRVRSLAFAAQYDDAIRLAQNLAESAGDDTVRLNALLALGDAHAEAGDCHGLERLERAVAAVDASGLPIGALAIRSRLDALRSRALFVRGNITEACALQTPEDLAQASPLAEPAERVLWALSLCQSASIHTSFGEYRIAAAQAGLAQDLIIGYSGPLESTVRIRTMQAAAEAYLNANDFERGRAKYREAYEFAVNHNLIAPAADIAISHALAEFFDGDAAGALKSAREIVPALRRLGAPESAWHFPMAAAIESGTGHYQRAIELLRETQALDLHGSERRAIAQALEAECLIALRRFREARRVNAEAIAHLRHAGILRPLGFAVSLAAEIDEATGDFESIRDHIAESLVLLERHGHPRALARALQRSARITGNRSHARQARELLAAN